MELAPVRLFPDYKWACQHRPPITLAVGGEQRMILPVHPHTSQDICELRYKAPKQSRWKNRFYSKNFDIEDYPPLCPPYNLQQCSQSWSWMAFFSLTVFKLLLCILCLCIPHTFYSRWKYQFYSENFDRGLPFCPPHNLQKCSQSWSWKAFFSLTVFNLLLCIFCLYLPQTFYSLLHENLFFPLHVAVLSTQMKECKGFDDILIRQTVYACCIVSRSNPFNLTTDSTCPFKVWSSLNLAISARLLACSAISVSSW